MTAWQLLTQNSSAQAGSSAWQHLNNQTGNGECSNNITVGTALNARIDYELKMTMDNGTTMRLCENG